MSEVQRFDIPELVKAHFAKNELVAAIAIDGASREVLMMAWMNEEALRQTISSRRVTYWSRSRQTLWEKGEVSGHTQELIKLFYDCDGDALLLEVNQVGAACHNGTRSCFVSEIQLPEVGNK
jgi:phosphoribosyl-AMP cyclohydrolase